MTLKKKFNNALDLDGDAFILFECEEIADEHAIAFHKWMRTNDTKENANMYFHFTYNEMLNVFKKEKEL